MEEEPNFGYIFIKPRTHRRLPGLLRRLPASPDGQARDESMKLCSAVYRVHQHPNFAAARKEGDIYAQQTV